MPPVTPLLATPPLAPVEAAARDLPSRTAYRRSEIGGPSGPAPAAAATLGEDAASLFADGNGARRRGDHDGAAAAYRHLIAQYPRSDEAHESLVGLARMLLDDGDAANALPYFEAYVNRGGVLAAEAMLGKALALERLGRAGEERRAWATLVEAYPDSVHAERARARLAELRR